MIARLRKLFPTPVIIVVVLAMAEAWIALLLNVNPACGSVVPDWVPPGLVMALLIPAMPGWIGAILCGDRFTPYTDLPVDFIAFWLAQFLTYFLATHAVLLLARKVKSRFHRKSDPQPRQNC